MHATGNEPGDWELVHLTAGGEPSAFETLVERYRKLLACMVLRRGSFLLGFSELDEIIDETWCRVLQRTHAGRFRESLKFSTWLVGILLNVLKDKRFRPCTGRAMAGSGLNPVDLTESTEPLADSVAGEAELFLALSECLGEQPERMRGLYQMIYVQGITMVSAGRQLRCSEANVRQRLLPALHKSISKCLARKGFR